MRGETAFNGGRFEWKAGLFRADSENDIISVASTIQGRGVFQNVEATRRQGLEAAAQYRSREWLVYASYSYIDATYQFTGYDSVAEQSVVGCRRQRPHRTGQAHSDDSAASGQVRC